MPHLYKIRKGWENEHLAKFILSRFSFIAHPVTIGDDIGSDFFCTLFEKEKIKKNIFLIPKNSFAIQIKSNNNKITNITTNFIEKLEIPFFVGVINQDKTELEFFSGEYFSEMISSIKNYRKLEIKLTDDNIEQPYLSDNSKKKMRIYFPKRLSININDSEEELDKNVTKLSSLCSHIQTNISTSKNKSYVFTRFHEPNKYIISTGKDSFKTFRENISIALAEAFANLEWAKKSGNNLNKIQLEYKIYEVFLSKLLHYKNYPLLELPKAYLDKSNK